MPNVTLDGVPQKLFRYDVDDVPVNGAVDVPPSSNRMFDHEADIDAHMADLQQFYRIGEYYYPWHDSLSNIILTVDTLYVCPLLLSRDITLDRIGVDVQITDAGKLFRVGIYNNGTNLYPGTLVLDAGTVSTTTAELVVITIDELLTKGLYWLAMVTNSAGVAAAHGGNLKGFCPLGQQAANLGVYQAGWSVAHAFGALPDPFTGGGALKANPVPMPTFRLSSLD